MAARRSFVLQSAQQRMNPLTLTSWQCIINRPTTLTCSSRTYSQSIGFPTVAATSRNDFQIKINSKGLFRFEWNTVTNRPGYCLIQQQRLFSTGSSSSSSPSANSNSVKTSHQTSSSSALQGPFKRVNVAEVRVAESLMMEVKRYEERHERVIREKATPEALLNMSLLEDELRGEMAVVLGRMDAKLKEKMKIMEEANVQVYAVLDRPFRDVPALLEVVKIFNDAQEAAYQARLDLIIQRQSAGFVQNNYHLIMQRYPIPPKKRVRL